MQKTKLFFKLIIFILIPNAFHASYSNQYMIALQDLIKVHKKYFPHDPIVMNNSSLVYSVYKKIITPWALNINGMAHIVQNKFYSKKTYWNDIQNLKKQFKNAQDQVENLKQYFVGIDTSELLAAFYKEIGDDVVQIFLNMIQQCTNALTLEQEDLEACFIAYQIAHEIYQDGMQITGIQEGSDFDATISGNMVVLYQNAISNLLNKLSIGMLEATTIENIYDQIARYYTYLAVIGTDAKDTQLISTSQAQASQACQNYGYYLQAQKLYQQAETLLKKYPNSVSLDITNLSSIQKSLKVIGQNIGQISQLVQKSNQYYTQAQDIFGANQAQLLYTLVDNVDLWIVQGVAQLWLLYLQDQSLQNQYTAPTIASFISSQNQNSSDPITNEQVIASLQNLSSLIEQKANPINALSTIDLLKSYSLDEIMASLKQEIITLVQSGVISDTSSSWMYNFACLQAIVSAQDILFYLTHLANSIANTLLGSGSDHALRAMAYAQALDNLYKNLSADIRIQVDSLVPYFPDQVQEIEIATKSTWSDWATQILLASSTINPQDLESSKIAKIQIAQPASKEKKPKKQDVSDLLNLAHQNALHGNFSKASQEYQQAMNMYTTLYSINPTDEASYANMMQAKTMYTALSFASTIQSSGNQIWSTIKNIPNSYVATKYGFNNISVSDLGMSELPASLLGIAAGSEYTTLTPKQQKDVLQILKAHAISQLLSAQGVEFSQIFVDYNLEFNSQIDQAGKALASQIRAQVDIAFNKFDGTEVTSIMLVDATTFESIMCKNVKLSDVTPLFSSMATALTFFTSAQLLVAPSKNQVKLGNASYVPGNDEKLSVMLLEKMIKVYVSAAYPHYQEAKNIMSQLSSLLQNNQNKSYPANFSNSLKEIDGHVVRAQALLYAQDQSAYAYCLKAFNKNRAQEIEGIFFDIYQEYVSWMKQCLVGKNPFDPTYQDLLHEINTVYVGWAALLQAQNQTYKVQTINNDIIALFKTAGQGCMNISYTQPLYPNFIQYHYATAAHYFIAVQMQYSTMKEAAKATTMDSLINDAYFKGSSQNINLFLHVQKHGVVITTQEIKQQENIAFSDLISQQIFASTAKQKAYDSVQNLLLNAGIGYSYLKKRVSKMITQNKTSKQAIISQSKSPLSSAVTLYLQSKNIMSSSDVIPSYFKAGVAQAIFATNMDAYAQFKNNETDYASWLDVVYSALQALYSINYLGAKPKETGTQMENQITAFFTELEKHTSSLENPSSVYVG